MKNSKNYADNYKRPLDVICAALGLVVTLPLTLPAAAILAVQNKGKIFHTETRVGKSGEPFDILKFKTIYDKGGLQQDKKRSPFSLFLRSHSIDELPQLVNVLKGQMSLIGPRPLRQEELKVSDDMQDKCEWTQKYLEARQMVKPGFAGLYEIKREKQKFTACRWEDRFALDYFYSKNVSLENDLAIGFQALKYSILGRSSANLPLTQDRYLSNYCESYAQRTDTSPAP